MAIPTLTDADIDRDSPLKQLLMRALRDRDRWLHDAATGAGINPNVTAFVAALLSHKHDGTAGHGDNIPTAGIANGAIQDSAMLGASAVTAGKIATKTMDTNKFQTGSVTEVKLHNTMGHHITGSMTFNTGNPPAGIDVVFSGDRKSFSNPKGALGVIVALLVGQVTGVDIPYFVVSVSAGAVVFGIRNNGLLPVGIVVATIDCWIM